MISSTYSLHPIEKDNLPSDWKFLPVGSVIDVSQYGTNSPSSNGGNTFVVGMKDISAGKISTDQLSVVNLKENEQEKYLLQRGDLLLNRTNSIDLVGKIGIYESDIKAAFVSYLVRLKVNQKKANPWYVNYWLNSYLAQKTIKRIATRAISQANVNPTEFKKHCYITLPPKGEQEKITTILSTWDTAIEKTERLITRKEEAKKGLMQRLLFGKVRLGNRGNPPVTEGKWFSIPSDWKRVEIGFAAKEISQKNTNGDDLPVLSCTKYQGLVDSLRYFDKQVFSKDTSTYKVVERGQFAYATNHIEEGSIGYQDLYPLGLISPMYTVFAINSQKINDGYLYKLVKTETFRRIFAINTNASVDRRGSLRWKDFAKLPIPLPELKEQEEINNVLETAQKEIILLQRKLDLLKKQKSGLIQKLLTGQWRVKVDNNGGKNA